MVKGSTVAIIALLGVGAIGSVFLLRRAKDDSSDILPPTIDGRDPFYQGVPFTAGGPATGPIDTSIRSGAPITSGSKKDFDIKRFAKEALGTCQCDDRLCCFKSYYQPERGSLKKERYCERIYYGDTLDACERVIAEFGTETFFAQAMAGLQNTPSYSNLVNARMARMG